MTTRGFRAQKAESSQSDGRLVKRKHTLRPRNDIAGPVAVDLWPCGPADLWTCGPVGLVDLWVYGAVDLWTYALMDL